MEVSILHQLDDMYLEDVTGGTVATVGIICAGIGLLVSFCIGVIDGYLNPNNCNYEGNM